MAKKKSVREMLSDYDKQYTSGISPKGSNTQGIAPASDTVAGKLAKAIEGKGLAIQFDRTYHTNVTVTLATEDKTLSFTTRCGEDVSELDAAAILERATNELVA